MSELRSDENFSLEAEKEEEAQTKLLNGRIEPRQNVLPKKEKTCRVSEKNQTYES